MLLVQTAVLMVVSCTYAEDLSFPPDFMFGAASAAYQVEGGWNASDKGESMWDRFAHTPHTIDDGSNGDVACDSYHNWSRDIEMASELGLHFYRFSISWTRLLPLGLANKVSEDGKKYYNNLIDGLLKKGIQPMVTLYHWDLPQTLQDLGGWTNPLISNWFADYARVVYSIYADRVKYWVTINEPVVVCNCAYESGIIAPGIIDRDIGVFLCAKNVVLAHAKAWRIYDQEYKSKFKGIMALTNHLLWFEGLSAKEAELADLANEYSLGFFSHPIYSKEGGWPPVIERIIANNSFQKGFTESRLPNFTTEEIALVKGTYDYFPFNHYTSRVVEKAPKGYKFGSWPFEDALELYAKLGIRPHWKYGTSKLFPIYPEGIRNIIKWIKNRYGNVMIIITENGYSTTGNKLNDDDRINYYKQYLKQVLLAIREDKANVTGYTAWTLMDNFEWKDGYRTEFGLYQVNFKDPRRKRTPRKSAYYYASIIRNHSLDVPDIPDIVIPNGQDKILFSFYMCIIMFVVFYLF